MLLNGPGEMSIPQKGELSPVPVTVHGRERGQSRFRSVAPALGAGLAGAAVTGTTPSEASSWVRNGATLVS